MHTSACEHAGIGTTHDVSAGRAVTAVQAQQVARMMAALATPSRVRILARLRAGPCAVSELSGAVDMAQPAVSQQLRVLRDLGLVVGTRQGRQVVYELHDPHIGAVLDEALRHMDHRHADIPIQEEER
jgi:DNA-binding transcriptional ArsR family regulator